MMASRAERHLILQRRLRDSQIDARGLRGAIEFYAALIRRLIDADTEIEPPELSADQLCAKWAHGDAALAGEAIGFDDGAVRDLLLSLCSVTEEFAQPAPAGADTALAKTPAEGIAVRVPAAYDKGTAGPAAAQIRSALHAKKLDFDALLDHLLAGRDDEIARSATSAQVDARLLITLARLAMRPTLQQYAELLEGTVQSHTTDWRRGVCPVCGSTPLLSEFRDQDQSRHLRCAACGTRWLFPRLQCAYCGNDRFRMLHSIRVDTDHSGAIDACDNCRRYVKALSAADPTPSDLLPLEDLLSLHLDAAAQAQGYQSMVG